MTIQEYIACFTEGALLNSRGCSGSILALFCKGISESVKLTEGSISNHELSAALKKGCEIAYQETTNPTEGTMLTMMRVLSEQFEKLCSESSSNTFLLIKKIIPSLEETLKNTPEMLPILKKAGVVDSGAMGFLILIKGISFELEYNESIIKPIFSIANILMISKYVHSFASGRKYGRRNRFVKTIISSIPLKNTGNINLTNIINLFNNLLQKKDNEKLAETIIQKSDELSETWNPNIKFRYCTEFILESENLDKTEFENKLSGWGDSLIIIHSNIIFKIHIHTNKPKSLLKTCEELGRISSTKIDDMKKQHHNLISEDKAYYNKDIALLFIVNGNGFAYIMKGLGTVDIFTYQNVKPSVNQIQNAILKTRAKNIIIAADDSDIIPALKSAITLSKSNIELIESKNIIQLINIMYHYSEFQDLYQNTKVIREHLDNIKFCKIARATRDFDEENINVKKGDFFSIYQNKIFFSSVRKEIVIEKSISELIDTETLITIYYGKKENKTDKIVSKLQSKFENITFESYFGGQNRYNYYITFE
jgi:dihydroxyacetone kinase-like predicted kinase